MKTFRFDGEEFNPADQMAFEDAYELLSLDGRDSFEKLLDEYDHDCFLKFKKKNLSKFD